MRSLSRPGVATTTSAPPRSAPACRPIDMPPTTVASRSFSDAGVRGERVGDLLGQLAGGDEDQGQRLAGLGALSGGAGQQGQAEGEGLAGAGAPAAQDVPAREGVRQGRAPGSGTARSRPARSSAASSCAGMSRSANASTAGSAGVIVSGRANSPWTAAGRRP